VLLAGGLLALLRMAVARNAATVLANLRTILANSQARLAGAPGAGFDPAIESADRMPYAFAILTGTAVYAGAKWSGWLKAL
jgi:prepilin peptidase CpaA